MYISSKIVLVDTNNRKSIFAIDDIIKDDVVLRFENNFRKYATKTSLQVDEEIHQESTNPKAIENFLNHSCAPNGYIDFQDMTYRAIRPIDVGEELTFNYLTTEWDMENPFDCECGNANCYGTIKGFRYLTIDQRKELFPFLSPFLKRKFIGKNE